LFYAKMNFMNSSANSNHPYLKKWQFSFHPVTCLRSLITLVLLIALCACSIPASPTSPSITASPQNGSSLVFVGTYTNTVQDQSKPEGIFVYRMDNQTGALTFLSQAGGLPNPSFLTVDPSRRYLLAVSETNDFNWQPGGGVSSYAIDPSSGALTLINSQPTGGADPCYVSVDPGGKWVLVTNYTGGSVAVFPLGADGRLGAATDLVQHQGSSVNLDRQAGPHAHSAIFAPGSSTLVLVADLGLDRIMLYDLDPVKGKLAPHPIPWLAARPGSGPRHMVFHPNQRFLYVVHELDSSVTAYQYDAAAGTFKELQTLSLLAPGFSGQNLSADIHITPSGKFLYASNRGEDSLAIFSIDENSGKLTALGQIPTQGKTPRNFAIDPTGNFLLAANQDSGTIVTFRIDAETGNLIAAGQTTLVPSPVCIKFFGK
jgi:6-phosphogluconolactonase